MEPPQPEKGKKKVKRAKQAAGERLNFDEVKLDADKEVRRQIKELSFDKDFLSEAEYQRQLLSRLRQGLEIHEKAREHMGYNFLKRKPKTTEIRESEEFDTAGQSDGGSLGDKDPV